MPTVRRTRLAAWWALVVVLSAACARPRQASAPAPPDYASESSWLCLPGRAGDACDRDLTATELRADGSRELVPARVDPAPKVDCFYVYPTVDFSLVPGNHEDFSDERIAAVAAVQAARFREVCAVHAPFYRQVTIGTYFLRSQDDLEAKLAIAYEDVERAFSHYLARWNRGRKIVLVGHSQGAEMVVRLLRAFFDHDDARRSLLLLAMPIGGRVDTPVGRRAGGTLANVPACSSPDEVGCVVAYRSHLAGSEPTPPKGAAPPAGRRSVCVNPAAANDGDGDARLFSRTFLPLFGPLRARMRGVEDVTTPFLLLRDYYAGRCVDGPAGYRYLAITPGTDEDGRVDPIDFERSFPRRGLLAPLGLHVLDMAFAQGDLIDMIARRAAALP